MKALDFIFAARPMLLLPVWSIYLITYNTLKGDKSFSPDALLILAALSLMYAGAYYLNQIHDYRSDLINKKLGFLQREIISRKGMVAAFDIVSLAALVIAFVHDYITGVVFVAIFVLGYLYSAPPPRFKDRPISGLLANAAAYGVLLPLAVPGFLEEIDDTGLMLLIYFFTTVAAGYMLTIIPDKEGDKKTGKTTLAVYFGDRTIIIIGFLFLGLSLIPALIMKHYPLVGVSLISMILFLTAAVLRKIPIVLFACKFPILMMSLLAGWYCPGYIIFLLALIILTRIYYKKRFGIEYPRLS